MNLYQFFKCLGGDHHRDGRRVHSVGNVDFSRCKGCGRRMIREQAQWRLEKRADRAKRGV